MNDKKYDVVDTCSGAINLVRTEQLVINSSFCKMPLFSQTRLLSSTLTLTFLGKIVIIPKANSKKPILAKSSLLTQGRAGA